MSEPLKLSLITEWYVDSSPARQAELLTALMCNLENERIGAVHIFGDYKDLALAPEHPKLVQQVAWMRPSFGQLFQFAADTQPGAPWAIANADVYFDRTLAALDDVDLRELVLCLSRWDIGEGGELVFHDRRESQDAWIFWSPLRISGGYLMGQRGCDNRLAWELRQAGRRLCNPARTVRLVHLHLSQKRGAKIVVPPPYMTVLPTTLEEGLLYCQRQ